MAAYPSFSVLLWETHEEAITVIHVGEDSCWTEGSHSDSTCRILTAFAHTLTSLVAQTVKHLSTMRETQVQSLEKEMVIHSSTIAWKIPWTKEPDKLQSMESQRVRHD